MTTGTVGYYFLAQLRSQTVIAVFVTADPITGHAELLCQSHALMTLGTTISPDRGRNGLRRSLERPQDVMNAVTVRADRRARHAANDRLPVNALHELARFGRMALAAGVGNIDASDRRLLVRCRFDVVTVMAIGTHGRAHVSAGDGFRVHALTISQQGLITDPATLHRRLVSVTPAARIGNVGAIDCRLRITCRQDRRHVAVTGMAVKTRRRPGAVANRLRMKTVIVSGVRRGVK